MVTFPKILWAFVPTVPFEKRWSVPIGLPYILFLYQHSAAQNFRLQFWVGVYKRTRKWACVARVSMHMVICNDPRTSYAVVFNVDGVAIFMIITQSSNAALWIIQNSMTDVADALSVTLPYGFVVSDFLPTRVMFKRTCWWIDVRVPLWIIKDQSSLNPDDFTGCTVVNGECLARDVTDPTTAEKRHRFNHLGFNSCRTEIV